MIWVLLWLLAGPRNVVRAANLAVCPAGPPACEYATIQAAVDAAGDGDVIKVASGIYTGINAYGGLRQVVYITKSVSLRGGYTTTFAEPPDPHAYPVTLDAEGQGRVIYIAGSISVTLEGLRITGGDATGLGGGFWPWMDAGGGVYAITATVAMSNNRVYSNTTAWDGGGIYLSRGSATLVDNVITANSADRYNGGLLLYHDNATIISNIIAANISFSSGSGLFIIGGSTTLVRNSITANANAEGSGGGGLISGDSTLIGNDITTNTAGAHGGGLSVSGNITLVGNTIVANAATFEGGGLILSDNAMLRGNAIVSNTANTGGGISFVRSNATLVNNVVADNRAELNASGLYILESSLRLLHNTIARNTGGDGSGIYIAPPRYPQGPGTSTIALTNTILVSQTIGITVATRNMATLEGTLWGSGSWANQTDWDGTGSIFTGTVSVWSEPGFVDPDASDYHIVLGSAAVDAGVSSGIDGDLDGDPRPIGYGYDIGADEVLLGLVVTKRADRDAVRPGEQLTYIIRVTNTGSADLYVTITDVLPAQVIPAGVLTWKPTITAPGGTWLRTVIVTVEEGYTGAFTNTVEVTSDEGLSGVYTATATVRSFAYLYLPIVLHSYP